MTSSFEEFQADTLRAGFDKVLVREWLPGYAMGEHAHEPAIQALVVRGELWVKSADRLQHCRAGDRFELDAGAVHSEGAGPEGAQFWVAQRHPAG